MIDPCGVSSDTITNFKFKLPVCERSPSCATLKHGGRHCTIKKTILDLDVLERHPLATAIRSRLLETGPKLFVFETS